MHTLIDGEFPKIILRASDGATAEIYLHGGHVVSWIPADGRERLFMSARAEFKPGAALRGGIPVAFPQFSRFGPMIPHGFARIMPWELAGAEDHPDGTTTARFILVDSPASRTHWDHAFQLELAATVGGPALAVTLNVSNLDSAPFDFTAALHTYFRVDDVGAISIHGLENRSYQEFGAPYTQSDEPLRISGEVDRIYWNVPGPVVLREGDQGMQVGAAGFADAVVWNPGPQKGDALVDLESGGFQHFVCIEAVQLGHPVTLPPGVSWSGTQTLHILKE